MSEDFFAEKPKPKRSPEHLAAMAAGRARAKAEGRMGKSRGRPAFRETPAPMPREALATGGDPVAEDFARQIEAIERGDVGISREQRGLGDTTFDIPEQHKRQGWVYTWWPFKVMAEEIDASVLVEYAKGGWLPVHPSHFPTLVPGGWKKPVIERQGMRLYMRPERLDAEARDEAHKQAFEQKRARLAQQEQGEMGREIARRDPRAGGISTQIQPLM